MYDTECMVLENDRVEQDDVRANVMSLESNGTRSMLEDSNANGVYELQKIIWIMVNNILLLSLKT